MKAGPDFQQTANSAMNLDPPTRGTHDPGQEFQQRTFSCPISTDESENLTLFDFERNIAQRKKRIGFGRDLPALALPQASGQLSNIRRQVLDQFRKSVIRESMPQPK